MKHKGIITSLSRKKTYVFIRPEGEERSVFCHRSEFVADEGDIRRGQSVEFELRKDDQGQAHRVRLAG